MSAIPLPAWWHSTRFVFDPYVGDAARGDILVGLGDPLDAASPGVVLNPKFRGSQIKSVTAYVRGADTATSARWRQILRPDMTGAQRVVLEDLSLDSCFALLLLAERMAHEAPEAPDPQAAYVDKWCNYVNRWEDGYTRDQRPWNESLAYLLTALGHSHLEIEPNETRIEMNAPKFEAGARACLDLLAAAYGQQVPPHAVDLAPLEQSGSFESARNAVEYERAQYVLALEHARTCQLRVPLRASRRLVLVDALFLEEHAASGLFKMFARSDREHTWTQRGFDVLGLYRPLERGSGGDMTISLAPEPGLTLESLWQQLEDLEDRCWRDEHGQDLRPRDRPRGIQSYRESTRKEPNQPWWDHYGTHSLLGAPRRVSVGGQTEYGTRLDWYLDVLPALWYCYRPVGRSDVLQREIAKSHGKRLVYCRWRKRSASEVAREADPAFFVADCPTFRGWLAAQSGHPVRTRARNPHPSRSKREIDVVSPLHVPSVLSYRALRVDGGLILVHRDGMTVFKDWTDVPLDLKGVRRVFSDMAEACGRLANFHAKGSMEKALTYHEKLLADRHNFDIEEFETWKQGTWRERSEALRAGAKALNHAEHWPLNEVRRLLASQWGFDEQREETLKAIDRIDSVTAEVVAETRERNTLWMQMIAAGVAGGLVMREVLEAGAHALDRNPSVWLWEIAAELRGEHIESPLKYKSVSDWDFSILVLSVAAGLACAWLYRKYRKRLSAE